MYAIDLASCSTRYVSLAFVPPDATCSSVPLADSFRRSNENVESTFRPLSLVSRESKPVMIPQDHDVLSELPCLALVYSAGKVLDNFFRFLFDGTRVRGWQRLRAENFQGSSRRVPGGCGCDDVIKA